MKTQQHAAAAHELAASALEVASSASESNKRMWLDAACDAQQAAAIEAKAAYDQLLHLIEIGHGQMSRQSLSEEDGETPSGAGNAIGKIGTGQIRRAPTRDWWITAVTHLARIRARKKA